MPIYQYRCADCGHSFDDLVRNSNSLPEKGCPSCGGAELVRQFSAFALGRAAKVTSAAACDVGPTCPSAGSCASGGSCPA